MAYSMVATSNESLVEMAIDNRISVHLKSIGVHKGLQSWDSKDSDPGAFFGKPDGGQWSPLGPLWRGLRGLRGPAGSAGPRGPPNPSPYPCGPYAGPRAQTYAGPRAQTYAGPRAQTGASLESPKKNPIKPYQT